MKLTQTDLIDAEVVALDIGTVRTGVARMNMSAGIPEPLEPLLMGKLDFAEAIKKLLIDLNAKVLVVGLPKNLSGEFTEQTHATKSMISKLSEVCEGTPIVVLDESLTSVVAEERRSASQSVDSVAAGILLEDFFAHLRRGGSYDTTF